VAPMRIGLKDIFTKLVDEDVPVAFRGYEGTVTGRRSPIATVEVRSPAAVGYIVTAPGELGVARAYVTGAIEAHGDLHAALRMLHEHRRRDICPRQLLRLARGIDPRLLRRPRVPLEEAIASWWRGLVRHTRRRDAAATPLPRDHRRLPAARAGVIGSSLGDRSPSLSPPIPAANDAAFTRIGGCPAEPSVRASREFPRVGDPAARLTVPTRSAKPGERS
jgi:hypothetical protein